MHRHCAIWWVAWLLSVPALYSAPLDLGDRLELFVDHHLIDQLTAARLTLGQPQPREISLTFDEPWEKAANYATVIRDGTLYRLYYRGCALAPDGGFDSASEVTCYAESRDGVHWIKPRLGLHAFRGNRDNNIILAPDPRRISHNFAPFLDDRPGVPAAERYKAVGGVFNDNGAHVPSASSTAVAHTGGLFRLVSADGLHWKLHSEKPVFAGYALDSLNCLAWIPAEKNYAIYLRTWSEGGTPAHPEFRGYRTVSRAVSPDFETWSEPTRMTFGDTPPENLYTNGTHAYFRAPHLLVALAFRFQPDRAVLSPAELARYGVHPTQRLGVSDAVLLTSRGGDRYDRTFLESIIRPGPDRAAWSARNNAPALGVVPTGETEMSLYLVTHYTQPDCRLQRYTLRTDGFASVRAPFAGGTLLTKPFTFAGARLVLNYATSAAGTLRVELLDETSQPLPAFTAADCDELIGDEIARTVTWHGHADLSALAGRPVRLRFVLRDADLYSLRFQP
ncbi:MAG: hypothetical protein H7343_14460 [Undibacterium sp.]|nr:hypothetical protein [Opitutaceae bacterium]